jgi:formamidopyrimidine-DNA glycosylase
MPELPEVETIVRGLAPRLAGRRILNAEFRGTRDARSRILLGDLSSLAGRTIREVSRRGKFVIVHLCAPDERMAIHLGMTGKLLLDAEIGPHTHVVVTLEDGTLLYDDIRQFGRFILGRHFRTRVDKLGPDALSLGAEEFVSRLRARRAMVKPLLLNQTFVGGLGNIYVDEALHRAGIHPRANTARLSVPRSRLLYDSIRAVLLESIASGGSSISDYVDSAGRSGSFQSLHRVYGKEGEPCLACGAPIRRILVAQRGTHFCPRCQKR